MLPVCPNSYSVWLIQFFRLTTTGYLDTVSDLPLYTAPLFSFRFYLPPALVHHSFKRLLRWRMHFIVEMVLTVIWYSSSTFTLDDFFCPRRWNQSCQVTFLLITGTYSYWRVKNEGLLISNGEINTFDYSGSKNSSKSLIGLLQILWHDSHIKLIKHFSQHS